MGPSCQTLPGLNKAADSLSLSPLRGWSVSLPFDHGMSTLPLRGRESGVVPALDQHLTNVQQLPLLQSGEF